MLGDQASFCQVRPRSAVGSGASDYGTVGVPASFVVAASRESLRASESEKPVRWCMFVHCRAGQMARGLATVRVGMDDMITSDDLVVSTGRARLVGSRQDA
jgi:hypothetical protein